jgi:hypothetical protein
LYEFVISHLRNVYAATHILIDLNSPVTFNEYNYKTPAMAIFSSGLLLSLSWNEMPPSDLFPQTSIEVENTS